MNHKEFQIWLESQSREMCTLIAARAALRVVPLACLVDDRRSSNILALFTWRAIVTSGVAGIVPNPDVIAAARLAVRSVERRTTIAELSTRFEALDIAARVAATAANAAHADAADAAGAAADAVLGAANAAAGAARAATDAAAFKDTDFKIDALKSQPIWHTPDEPDFVKNWKQQNPTHLDAPEFAFWKRLYEGFVAGRPIDWELQRRVALIDETIWEKGAQAVADKIARIEAVWLSEKLPQAEDIRFNADSGKLFLETRRAARPPLLAATLSQVEDALEDSLAKPNSGITEGSRESIVLRRTLAKYGNNPQRIEMDLTTVHAGITRQLATEELPASEENLALLKALEEGAQGIRATDPEIAENRRILTHQAISELDPHQLSVLSDAQEVLEGISEGELAEDFAEDIPFLLSADMRLAPPTLGGAERNPVLAGYDEKVRVFGRAAKMFILLKKFPELVDRFRGTATFKTMDIVTKISGVVRIGIGLIRWFT